MKLVEILAKHIAHWPDRVQALDQMAMGEIIEAGNCARVFCVTEKADFPEIVTRAQWEAERARIAIQERYSQDGIEAATQSNPEIEAHIADLTAIACGKRSKEDQELWDKAFLDSQKMIFDAAGDLECIDDIAYRVGKWVDAFMKERAKRMKG